MERIYKIPIFLISVLEMIFLAFFTFVLNGHISANTICIVLGIAFMVASIPVHIFGKRAPFLYIFSILLNLLGSAWFCAMYYTSAEQNLTLGELFPALIPAGILLVLTLILLFTVHDFAFITLILNFALSVDDHLIGGIRRRRASLCFLCRLRNFCYHCFRRTLHS